MPTTLARSLSLLRAHPALSLALGSAIVLSICALCTGVGLLAAPWFVCELLGVQLAASGRSVAPRGNTWLAAAAGVAVMLVIAVAAGWLAMLSFRPGDWDEANGPLPWPETLERVGLFVGSCALAVLFMAPFIHAPLILLDRGGRIGGAMMESAMLVRTTGLWRHLAIAVTAQVLALTPPVVAGMFVARMFARAATPFGFLAALPFMPLTVALGLGLVTATYLDVEGSLGDARRAQRLDSLPVAHRWSLAALLTGPILGLLLLGASAFWQAPPTRLLATDDTARPLVTLAPGDTRRIGDTALSVSVSARDVEIQSAPEPPVRVPSAWRGTIDSVDVRRDGDEHALEIHTGDGDWYVRVDRAGDRTDPSARDSLLSHSSGWVLAAFVGSTAIVALFAIRAFAPLGAARARAARTRGTRAVDADSRLRSFRVALALLPFALLALASGALAFLRA